MSKLTQVKKEMAAEKEKIKRVPWNHRIKEEYVDRFEDIFHTLARKNRKLKKQEVIEEMLSSVLAKYEKKLGIEK